MPYPLSRFSGSPAPGVAPKAYFPAASEGVFKAVFLATLPAASDAAFTGDLPPAFPGARREAFTAARTGALEVLSGAAPHTAIGAAWEVRYPVLYAVRTNPGSSSGSSPGLSARQVPCFPTWQHADTTGRLGT